MTDGACVAQPTPPDTIQVGAYRYTVHFDQAVIDAASRDMKASLTGHSDHITQTIAVSPGLGPDAQAETLLHECFHAILTQVDGTPLEDRDEERLVVTLGYQVLDLLRRNPELVAYLMHEQETECGPLSESGGR